MAKLFDKIKKVAPKLNKFDLSHERKLSLNMGYLVPIFWKYTVPGDRFRVNTEVFLRTSPLLAPMMHRVNVRTEWFSVPRRLIWEEFQDYITAGRDGLQAPAMPYAFLGPENETELVNGALSDYMGIPPTDGTAVTSFECSMELFRAYQLIYDEYYRDQNVTASIDISKASGEVSDAERTKLLTLRKSAWEKDVYTSALPFAQRGAAVTMPIDSVVTYKDTSLVKNTAGSLLAGTSYLGTSVAAGDGTLRAGTLPTAPPGDGTVRIENIDSISSASFTINALRQVARLQEFLENNARGGARYVEQILMHFGVVSSDARLQRPEYLGGGRNPLVISEVLSTFEDSGTDPQGTMAGHGVGVGNQHGFSRRFEEHCIVIGLMRVLPKTAYQQGIPKRLIPTVQTEEYFPEFANLGEQEVDPKEVYFNWEGAHGTSPFGYQQRYYDEKYMCDSVHGDFRSTLSYWHMGRIFTAPPELNTAFIEADPTHRIFPVTDPAVHKLYCQVYNHVSALRPMPYFGTPRL